jgi:hypothetical protein
MKPFALLAVLATLIGSAALAAEKFEDPQIKLSIQAPEGFTPPEAKPELPPQLGEIKAVFADKTDPKKSAFLLIHHMTLDGGYEDFKQQIPQVLSERLGTTYKLSRQEDTQVGKYSGFLLEFEAPGDGRLPVDGGTFRHHVRWYLLRDGEDKLVGLIYHSLEDAWKELEPKYAASLKTLKKTE